MMNKASTKLVLASVGIVAAALIASVALVPVAYAQQSIITIQSLGPNHLGGGNSPALGINLGDASAQGTGIGVSTAGDQFVGRVLRSPALGINLLGVPIDGQEIAAFSDLQLSPG
jgi:hypothetical protein